MKQPRVAHNRLEHYRRKLAFGPPELMQKLLSIDQLMQAVQACNLQFRNRLFTPVTTLWVWARQRLNGNASCREAVAHAIAWAMAANRKPMSSDCSAYCQARIRQALDFIQLVFRLSAEALEAPAMDPALPRRVFLVDATSCHVSDTAANREAFRGPSGQRPGCGLPVVKILGLFGLATGAAWALATGWTNASELGLFYSLWSALPANSLVLGDSNFGNFMTVAGLAQRQVDCLMRVDRARHVDFHKCTTRLGRKDALFTWRHPKRCPWMEAEHRDALPETVLVRVFEYRVHRPGFPSSPVTLVTTLLDAKEYPAAMLGALYARRWDIELDFRHIKATLGMERIDARCPEMVEKEIYMYMLTYNLIRQIMVEASQQCGLPMDRISFKGTVDLLRTTGDVLGFASATPWAEAYDWLLAGIGQRPARRRPHRGEPRVIKQRRNKYPYMNQPRDHYKHTTPVVEA